MTPLLRNWLSIMYARARAKSVIEKLPPHFHMLDVNIHALSGMASGHRTDSQKGRSIALMLGRVSVG
jgi:hypothetical protein